ncbi:choloylglycine hydrolase [Cellulomonas shaoxiangyii]|uniref:choloylglycine hydrolase n=1 Tax=Cellulomonas shaoxiangyii TaxID=2566013 RepID=A0A4V1CN07_9CELL|nr:choloylglycine hydrolase [Cellulomonas shaoxiangyii]QCB94785.1 choloylglycine hydrolase family protein [Cellulomonas shaoxiangyii]TGY86515.1 choloylglycine hydrolase family protein [Cellulomonas shaoxiangyii]
MCTGIRFSDGSGNLYLARNLDWTSGYGERVVVTPTGFVPTSPFGAVPSIRHATIGMGIVEEGTPLYFDCGNDAGLAVAGLNFPGYASYAPGPVDGKTNVAAYEFPLWVASQFASVDEVQAALKDVAIVDKPINEKYPSSLLHWIIGDATRAIVVEHTSDGMHVFDDDVDVLANQPGFAWHHENLRNYLNTSPEFPEATELGRASLTPFGSGSHMRGVPGDYYSPSRFVRAAYVNEHYPTKASEEENVSRAFHTLQQVAMVDGCAAMGSGEFEKTIYTGLFSSRTNTYYWNTYDDPAIHSESLADHSPDGTELVVV